MSGVQKTKIGIMGGTFDPIHYGHLFIAECSRHRFNLSKVLFVPTGMPVHKRRTDAINPVHRLEMTRLAVCSNPNFEVSSIELDRPGPTYTVDTLQQLYRECNGCHDYFFITGADAILEILTWKDVDRVLELCRFIAVTRPGYSLIHMNKVTENLTEIQRERIYIFETSGILVSSTDIRERIAKGEPFKYMVPEGVEKYITKNRLYNSEDT